MTPVLHRQLVSTDKSSTMKVLILAALVAVAAAQEYHRDDSEGSFHFTTLKDKTSIGSLAQGSLGLSSGSQSSLLRAQGRSLLVAPAQTQYTVQKVQQIAAAPVASTILARSFEQEIPAFSQQQYTVQQVQQIPATASIQIAQAQPIISQQRSINLVQDSSLSSLSGASRSTYTTSANAPKWRILEWVQEVDPSGPYKANYKTENGIQASEQGALTASAGPEGQAVAKQGSYSWTSPEGLAFTVSWIADESGFRASGDHLPTPPPIPEEIQRSLQLIAASGNKFDDQSF